MKKDIAEGGYNPVSLRYGLSDGVWTPESRREFALTLDHSIHQMAAAFELWNFGVWTPIFAGHILSGTLSGGTGCSGRYIPPEKYQRD